LGALKFKADSMLQAAGTIIIEPHELLKTYEIGFELVRAARQGLSFSMAMLKIDTYEKVLKEEGEEAAHGLMKDVLALFEKNIRAHDNVTILGNDRVVLLTAEYSEEELTGFLARMTRLITEAPTNVIRRAIPKEDLHFVGICISEKIPFMPEEFMEALKGWMDAQPPIEGIRIITPEELERFYAEQG
jgi:GGDEF domain-containing protein